MADSEAKVKWDKEHTINIMLKLNLHTNSDIISWLGDKRSKAGAVKAALSEYIRQEHRRDVDHSYSERKALLPIEIEKRFAAIDTMPAEIPSSQDLAAISETALEDPKDAITLDEYKASREIGEVT